MAESLVMLNPLYVQADISWHNKSTDSPVWDQWYPRLRVAVLVIFLLYFLVAIPTRTYYSRRRSRAARRVLGWKWYFPGVISMVIYLIVAIVSDCYLNSLRIHALTYLKTICAVYFFRGLANVFILSAILYNAIPLVLRFAAMKPKQIQTLKQASLALIVLVTIMFIVHIGIWDNNILKMAELKKAVDDKYGVAATFVTLYLIASMSAATLITRACWRSKLDGSPFEGVFPSCYTLSIAIVGLAVIEMIVIFGYKVDHHKWTRKTSIVFGILSLFFQALTFGALCEAVKHKELEYDGDGPETDKENMTQNSSTANA